MVHKRKKVYVVSAFYGTPNAPYREGYIVFGKDAVKKKIDQLKKEGNAKNIHVERDGLKYIQAFTLVGGLKARQNLKKDKPNKVEVVWD